MSELRTLTLRFPGSWRDAWLYKEHVILWARDGRIHFVPMGAISRWLGRTTSPSVAILADYLIFRNDWKASEQFRRLLEFPGLERSLFRPLADAGNATVYLDEIAPEPLDVERTPGIMLDVAIYANRVYSATTEGLFESYFHPKYPRESRSQEQHLDFRVSKLAAKYATVNASAEQRGLWFSPIEFYGFDDDSNVIDDAGAFDLLADESITASFASRHLLNYTDEPIPTFLRSEGRPERSGPRAQFEDWRITRFDQPADISSLMTSVLESDRRTSLSESRTRRNGNSVTVLGNSDYRLLVESPSGLAVMDLSAFPGREIEARPDREFAGASSVASIEAGTSILETYAIGGGFLVELFDSLRLLTPQGSHTLFTGQAARVRTFVHSRRHRETAVVVDESGLNLIGFAEIAPTDRQRKNRNS